MCKIEGLSDSEGKNNIEYFKNVKIAGRFTFCFEYNLHSTRCIFHKTY